MKAKKNERKKKMNERIKERKKIHRLTKVATQKQNRTRDSTGKLYLPH